MCVAIGTMVSTVHAADVLLIPDSTTDTVMAFDPADGTLLDAAFIPDPGSPGGFDVLIQPIHAIDSGRGTILVSDQNRDAVLEFGFDGSYIRVFTNGGVIDNSVLNNVRGIAMRPNGELLVCNSGNTSGIIEANRNAVVPFDSNGVQAGQFIFQRYGGIDGPFGVLVLDDMVLVSSDSRNFIARYTPDNKFDDLFARDPQFSFLQQIALSQQNTILVAAFSPGFIAEYARDGTQLGVINPPSLSGYRGVAELDNGNLLVTTGTGVHEVTRTSLLVQTERATSGARFIERVKLAPEHAARLAGKRGGV